MTLIDKIIAYLIAIFVISLVLFAFVFVTNMLNYIENRGEDVRVIYKAGGLN